MFLYSIYISEKKFSIQRVRLENFYFFQLILCSSESFDKKLLAIYQKREQQKSKIHYLKRTSKFLFFS